MIKIVHCIVFAIQIALSAIDCRSTNDTRMFYILTFPIDTRTFYILTFLIETLLLSVFLSGKTNFFKDRYEIPNQHVYMLS